MARVPSGFVNQGQIAESVGKVTGALATDVAYIRYNLGEDWNGDGAIFFRVVLRDKASIRNQLRDVARRVVHTVFQEVRPNELGLQAYFNFRSESEQAELKEEAWV